MRVVWHAFLRYNRVVRGEFADEVIQKMPALVADELYQTSKMTPYVFVNEFGRGHDYVVMECLGLDPFYKVVGCHDDMFTLGLGHNQFEGADEIQPPLLDRF